MQVDEERVRGAEAEGGVAAAPDDEAREEALRQQRRQRVMQRIEAQPDLVAVKTSMVNLQQVSRSDRSHVRALTGLIHDDPAMLAKLLRLVNAAYFRAVGGGEITSMARAVHLLGFQKVGMLASSLRLFDSLPPGAAGQQLQREFARGQLAGLIAQSLCQSRRHAEHIHLSAVFQRLGDLLTGLHCHDDAQVIEDQLDLQSLVPESLPRQRARDRLARAQWGATFEELGHDVARGWGWPEALLAGMRSLHPGSTGEPMTGDDYARGLCTAANTLAGELMQLPHTGSPEEQAAARGRVAQAFGRRLGEALGLEADTLPDTVEQIHADWLALLKALGLTLLPPGDVPAPAAPRLAPGSQAHRQHLADHLADAIEHLRRLNRRGAPLPEVLEAALKQLTGALGLQRAVACLVDPEAGALRGRLGVGDKAVVLAPFFDIPLRPPGDLFGLLCARNADTLIRDASDPVIAQRLPGWFGERVRAGTFLVLPLVATTGQVVGMLYGDQRDAGDLVVHDRGLALLRDLRQQVLNALLMPRG